MSERHDQIVRLLDVWEEHLPIWRQHGPRVESGFVHVTLAPEVCEVCEGVDSHACTGCGGRGSVERPRQRDPMAKDVVLPYGMTPDRKEAEQARDRQIQILREQIRPASAVDEDADAAASPYPWERARTRLYATTDLAALNLALEQLRLSWPGPSHDRSGAVR